MSYVHPEYLQWAAGQAAGQALTVELHTGEPGNALTANRATSNSNTAGITVTVAANAISATGGVADNDGVVTVFTPNATSAGQAISHVSYKFGSTKVGWVALAAPVTTVDGVPFEIAAGTIDLAFRSAA